MPQSIDSMSICCIFLRQYTVKRWKSRFPRILSDTNTEPGFWLGLELGLPLSPHRIVFSAKIKIRGGSNEDPHEDLRRILSVQNSELQR
jgi:hypothetical protein